MLSQTINRFVKGVTEFAVKHSTKVKGSGNVKSNTHPQPPFKKVVLKIPATASVAVSAGVNEITVVAPDNFHQYLKVRVKGNELVIDKAREFDVDSISEIQIKIRVPKTLDGILVWGSGVVNSTDVTALSKSVSANVHGSGKIYLRVQASNEVDAIVFGSGGISIDGTTAHLKGSVNGSGSLNFQKLICHTAKVDVFGSGLVDVFASEELNAAMYGSGTIYYSGNPEVKSSVSGSGKIVQNNSNNN